MKKIISPYLLTALLCIPLAAYSDTKSKNLFDKYRNANNLAFQTGDTSHIFNLYGGDIEKCWIKNNTNYASPIIHEPIPEDAKYSLKEMENNEYDYLSRSGFNFYSKPTHSFEISYKTPYFSTCSNKSEAPSTGIKIAISMINNTITMPAICPSQAYLDSKAKKYNDIPAELSLPFLKSVLSKLSVEEMAVLKLSEKNIEAGIKLRGEIKKISVKYGINMLSMRMLKYELCKTKH